jgi:uncharacterized membrane protein YfcA
MNIAEFAAATLSVIIGSIVQVMSGVGGGFIIVPMLAWVDMGLVPGPLIFASLALSCLMMMRGRDLIDWRFIPATLLGMIPGSIAGAVVLNSVPADNLGMVFGTVILAGIAITSSGLKIPLTRMTAIAAGTISGAMGTSSGIGAPLLALIYQHESGPKIRATLAALYTGASILILLILFAFGRFRTPEVQSGLALMPGFIAGYWIANHYTAQVDRAGSRIAVLLVSAAAALALIVKSW